MLLPWMCFCFFVHTRLLVSGAPPLPPSHRFIVSTSPTTSPTTSTTHAPMHHYPCTTSHAPTHAWPSLPLTPDPDPVPTVGYALALHATAAAVYPLFKKGNSSKPIFGNIRCSILYHIMISVQNKFIGWKTNVLHYNKAYKYFQRKLKLY